MMHIIQVLLPAKNDEKFIVNYNDCDFKTLYLGEETLHACNVLAPELLGFPTPQSNLSHALRLNAGYPWSEAIFEQRLF